MGASRAELVIDGDVLVAVDERGPQIAEAIGIADGRVVAAGRDTEVRDAAAPSARIVDARGQAVIPGLHDSHIHLAWLARARLGVDLHDVAGFDELRRMIAQAASEAPPAAWVRGRGWSAEALDIRRLAELEAAVGGRPALLGSRDGHSVWASAELLRRAGVASGTPDPVGGRIERDAHGAPNGVLRETAVRLLDEVLDRPRGADFERALAGVLHELSALGITGVTDAGDFGAAGGAGRYAALGDSFSTLAEARSLADGRLRLTLNLPAEALAAAAGLGLRTAEPLADRPGAAVGWAKAFADGALGSRTAALFAPYSCESGGDGHGLLTLQPAELDALLAQGEAAGMALAVHAIGDRAAAVVLDALERAPRRDGRLPPHRIEHAQLVRPSDRPRIAAVGAAASMQPIHCASDRGMVERCWAGREAHAFAWRPLAEAGVRLVFGSDAPVESFDPWLGCYAAANRRLPDDRPDAWHPELAVPAATALAGYASAHAVIARRRDFGHLRPGAVADLAVLDRPLADLLADAESLPGTRAELTLVGGREVASS